MIDKDGYRITFGQWLRQKRIEKRLARMERGEPRAGGLVIRRAIEYFILELIISVVLSCMVYFGVVPSVKMYALVIMAAGFAVYLIYAGITGHQIFWAIGNPKIYLIVNLGGYAVMMFISIIMRLIHIVAYSWMFLPFKVFTIIGFSAWSSMWICHGIMIVLIFALLINIKFYRYNELNTEEYDEEY